MVDTSNYIGIGQMRISKDPTTILIAPNLGSCLGIAIYDPVKKVGGLIHCLLPLSKSNPEKAEKEPYHFVDTGLVTMLQEFIKQGCDKKNLMISVAGGSNINDENKVFEIGARNYTVLKKVLWKNNLLLKGEDCGDSISRTVTLNIGTGEVFVKSQGVQKQLM
jgi:chemotaxis protein CheD